MPNPRAEIIQAAADPAAGGEIVFTAPEDMIVHSIRFSLVTNATVANRVVALVADDGTNEFFRSIATATHPQSQNSQYSAYEGAVPTTFGGLYVLALPDGGLQLRKGDRLRTSTTLIDPGDDFGLMRLQAERV